MASRTSYIGISVDLPRGEELARTDELARFFENRLQGMPEVERFMTNVRPQAARIEVTFPDSLENTDDPGRPSRSRWRRTATCFGGAEVRVTGYGPSFYGGGG